MVVRTGSCCWIVDVSGPAAPLGRLLGASVCAAGTGGNSMDVRPWEMFAAAEMHLQAAALQFVE